MNQRFYQICYLPYLQTFLIRAELWKAYGAKIAIEIATIRKFAIYSVVKTYNHRIFLLLLMINRQFLSDAENNLVEIKGLNSIFLHKNEMVNHLSSA